jgi:hypothetical protein
LWTFNERSETERESATRKIESKIGSREERQRKINRKGREKERER